MPSTHSAASGHHRQLVPGRFTGGRPSTRSSISALTASSSRRAADAQHRLGDVFDDRLAGVEVERRQLARRHLGAKRLDEGVEAQVVAVLGRDPAGLEVDDQLAALGAGGPAEREVDLARQHDRAVDGPPHGGLGRGCGAPVERREALLELDQLLDGETGEVGAIGLGQSGDPVAEARVVVGEPGDRLVDHVGGHRIAAPVDQQLDRPVGDLTTGDSGRPGERLVVEVLNLAPEHARHTVLAHEHRLVTEPLGEQLEGLFDVGPQRRHEGGVEHDRLVAAAQQRQRAALQRRQRQFVDGGHAVDTNQGVSQPGGSSRCAAGEGRRTMVDMRAKATPTASGAGLSDVGLLERDQHAAQLDAWWNEVLAGNGRMAVVAGEAGIGKSALVRAWHGRYPSAPCLWGSCDGLHTPEPLGPFADIAGQIGGEVHDAIGRGEQPAVVCRALVERLQAGRPAIVVIEDVHWADEATLDVLRMLGRRIERVRALVIVTYRADHVAATHPAQLLIGDLSTSSGVRRIRLPALSPAGVDELASPHGIDGAALYQLTAGNPFFVTEVIESEAEGLPATVADAVLARAGRLGPAAWSLIETVSVAPPHIELWALRAVCGDALAGLDQALASGIVQSDGDRVGFRHELARMTIEDQLGAARRADLHRQLLAVLRTNGVGEPSRLAHHAESAGDADLVLELAPVAAEHAAGRGAHREAAAHYSAALRFAGRLSPYERAEMYERFSYLSYITDQSQPAVAALESAIECYRSIGDQRREALALCQLSRRVWCGGESTASNLAMQRARAALTEVPEGREWAVLWALETSTAANEEDAARVAELGPRALELAERFDVEALVYTLNNIGVMDALVGRLEGVEMLERSRQLAIEHGLDEHIGRADIHLAWAITRNRAYHLAHLIERGVRESSESGLELWSHYTLAYRARMELDLGQWSQATESVRVIDRHHRDARMLQVLTTTLLATVRARRGDPECWTLLDQARGLVAAEHEMQYLSPVAIARAEAAWVLGRHDQVGEDTGELLEVALRLQSPWIAGELLAWRRRSGIEDPMPGFELAAPFDWNLPEIMRAPPPGGPPGAATTTPPSLAPTQMTSTHCAPPSTR